MDVYQGFAQLLNEALSSVGPVRKGAEQRIREHKKDNEIKFLNTLVLELVSDGNTPDQKQLASVLFKNTLVNPTKDEVNFDLWMRQGDQMRQNIKDALLPMLGSLDNIVMKAAATCLAAISCIELPNGMWPDFIQLLSNNAQSDEESVRRASLQTLGFICEDIHTECFSVDDLNLILFSVLSNIFPDKLDLTQIAMKSFARAAPITARNFLVPEQKIFIMDKLFLAGEINDEDILSSLMEAMNDIVKNSYDCIGDQIQRIGNLTIKMINSDHDKPAKLAIEVWSTFAEVEMSRTAQGKTHQGILANCLESILEIILTGLRKFDQETQDENLDEMPENSLTVAAGYTLENITRVVGNGILQQMIPFIQQRVVSERWGDRYISLIAFGSIIDGPDPQQIISNIGEFYTGFVNIINDPTPKVRQTAAFVLYKMSEFLPDLIISSQANLDLFVNNCLIHLPEHHLISTLVMGALRNLVVSTNKMNAVGCLNNYFVTIFQELFKCMYREDIHQVNEIQSVSAAINDVAEFCDANNLQQQLFDALMVVLSELQNSVTPGAFILKFLTQEQKEYFQNSLGGLVQILIVKIKGNPFFDAQNTTNILMLIKSLFDSNGKVIMGGLFILHSLIFTLEAPIEQHIENVGQFVVASIALLESDENCCRFACGLVSDLSNFLEKQMSNYAGNFIGGLNTVIRNQVLSIETKLHAMIALGDLCLAIEEHFQPHLGESIDCLFMACEISLQPPQNPEEEETNNKLRDAIIDAFISIIHGMQPLAETDPLLLQTLQAYAGNILHYIDALLQKGKFNPSSEFIMNLYELYSDILEYYSAGLQVSLTDLVAPKILKDSLPQFLSQIPEIHEAGTRFMSCMARIPCAQ